jgi:hypothetical protein
MKLQEKTRYENNTVQSSAGKWDILCWMHGCVLSVSAMVTWLAQELVRTCSSYSAPIEKFLRADMHSQITIVKTEKGERRRFTALGVAFSIIG